MFSQIKEIKKKDEIDSYPITVIFFSVTHLIELAEEKTGCEYLVIALDRRHLDSK